MSDDEFYDILYQYADTVIEIREIDPETEYRNEVFKLSKELTDSFFEEIKKEISECKEEIEIIKVKEKYFNFLLFSIRKIVVDLDCPDENIEILAENVKEKIIEVTRKNWEKKQKNHD